MLSIACVEAYLMGVLSVSLVLLDTSSGFCFASSIRGPASGSVGVLLGALSFYEEAKTMRYWCCWVFRRDFVFLLVFEDLQVTQ